MSRLRVHTTEQPDSDITTFVLSCDRLHLLEKVILRYLRCLTVIGCRQARANLPS